MIPYENNLNRQVAEKIMGWYLSNLHAGTQNTLGTVSWCKDEIDIIKWADWNPLEDLNQCFQIVERLRENHCCITIYSDGNYCWRIELIDVDSKTHKPYVIIDGEENLNEAILRASLKTLERP